MQRQCEDRSALKWLVCDLVTGEGVQENATTLLANESFDIIVDKGTLDAVLVEGTIHEMLQQVHRMLSLSGAYVLCTLNSQELMRRLLAPDLLHWKLSFFSYSDHANIVICRKESANREVDWREVALQEIRTLNEYFQREKPLLTPEIETNIKAAFQVALTIEEAHRKLFSASGVFNSTGVNEFLGYDLELFKQDLIAFPLADVRFMSAEEMIAFISAMQ